MPGSLDYNVIGAIAGVASVVATIAIWKLQSLSSKIATDLSAKQAAIVDSKADLVLTFSEDAKGGDRGLLHVSDQMEALAPIIVKNLGRQTARDIIIEVRVPEAHIMSLKVDCACRQYVDSAFIVWQLYVDAPIYPKQQLHILAVFEVKAPAEDLFASARIYWTDSEPNVRDTDCHFVVRRSQLAL